jgi:hypothetical protein
MTEPLSLPATVFVPSERVRPGDTEANLVLRNVDDALVMLVYSSTGALVQALGADQPWVALPADVADDLAVKLGVAAILLDADLTGPDRPDADAPGAAAGGPDNGSD